MLENIEGLTPELKAAIEEQIKSAFVPKNEFDAVNAKRAELLGEKKEQQRKAEEKAAEAEAAKLEAMKSSGDVESLKKFYEEKVTGLSSELETIKTTNKKQILSGIAKQFVSDRFVDDALIRKAAVKDFESRIDQREGKTVVLDAEGNLTGMSVEDLEKEFLNTDMYKKHIVQSRATGGGAAGGGRNSGSAAKTVNRAEFDALNPSEKMAFMKAGGKVT